MEILRKTTEDNKPTFHVRTNLGLIIKIKAAPEMDETEITQLLEYVANDMDNKLKSNIE